MADPGTHDLGGVTVVFDLDGTLVDTAPDLLRALAAVMATQGLMAPPADETRLMVGQGARALIQRAAAFNGVVWPDAHLDELTEAFVAVYAADIAAESRPFPGVAAALDALAAAGARLAVCTNKRTGLSVQLLEALGLAQRFAAVVGADSVPARKPAPGHYVAAVTAAGGEVARSVMVGDSAADVTAAHAAGAPVIAVRFGYCEEGVETLGADRLIDDYADLGVAVRALIGPPAGP
ncbi:MAG: phosphoglycolate phosphatase [Hyphomonadaceae bacterium]|nr:phosphoglycolate phosphatase [Hyphomonadaceae bacterium]